jgi:putative membrane protein
MASLDTGIDKLLAGATQLDTATKDIGNLKTGAASLAVGAEQLNNGITAYTTGVDTLISSVTQTTQVLSQYAAKTGDKTISALVAGLTSKENQASLKSLSEASTNLKTASGQIYAGASKLSDGTANVTELKAGISQLKDGLQTAKNGSSALSDGAKTLSSSMNKINTATSSLSSASEKLSKGASSLNSGLNSLQSGTSKLYTGAGSLFDGVTTLDDGANKLKDGTVTLANGTSDLDDGANKIKDGLQTAKDGVDESITDANDQLKALDGLDKYAENPVEVTTDTYAPVPNYGTAFAPYFMSLSLWVGGLMIFFGIYLDADGKFKVLSRNSDNKLVRTLIYLLIGVAQAFILAFVLLVVLGLEVNHLPMFLGSCILVSLVFISIIQFLLIFLKDIGKFVALLLLILQLTSCGGTFPMETVPKLFNVLYPFMPMTYSVGLFKESISGVGSSSLAWHNAVILLITFAVVIGVTLLFTAGKKVKENALVEA